MLTCLPVQELFTERFPQAVEKCEVKHQWNYSQPLLSDIMRWNCRYQSFIAHHPCFVPYAVVPGQPENIPNIR